MDLTIVFGILFISVFAVVLLFVIPLLEKKNGSFFVEKKKETITQLPYNKKDV